MFMIKKILLSIFLVFSFINLSFASCDFKPWDDTTSADIAKAVGWCLNGSDILVQGYWDTLNVEDGQFKDTINKWTQNIAGYLLLFAIWAIAYGWFMMVVSTWDDEKIKKWKDIVIWWMVWALWIVWASSLIAIIVKLMYGIWG